MEPGNDTQISEFILLGFSEEPELQPLIFGLFLSMYLITVFGNLLIILTVSSDSHLHTPMYFFLSNLSFVDICFISTTIPKMLWNIQTQSKVITYEGCITQIYFFLLSAVLDIFLLTVMAYDRFVAICHPLHYTIIMNPRICGLLVLVSWIMCILNSLLQSLMMLQLSFCTNVEIPHFFCDLSQMTQLACSDNFLNYMVIYFTTALLGSGALTGILYSYSKIISSIHRITSTQGKYKAFSTCASHLSVVSLFFSTSLGVYFSSAATHSSHSSATASVMYTVVTPMLNPFIYSLRNKDIKGALKRLFGSMPQSQLLVQPQQILEYPRDEWRRRERKQTHTEGSALPHMEPESDAQISKFLLLGFSEEPELQTLIFGLFVSMYLIFVFGNLLIILTVSSDPHLHTPMYFFLSNLSFADICFISTTIPKML
nr:olfactory receptor 7A5-like [Odocoileus virginianus texanus]